MPLLGTGIAAGLAGGVVAVRVALTIPGRMGREPRKRSPVWWGLAYVVGGLYGALIAATVNRWAVLPAFLVFGVATLALALIDLDHQLIPNRVLFPSLGVGAALLLVGSLVEANPGAWLRGAAGGTVYFAGLLVVGLTARGGFGMGDVKLALLLGLFLAYVGWGTLAVGAVLAVLLGGVASIALLVSRQGSRKAKFAYGPYLVLGAWMALIWGETIVDWYLGSAT